MSSLCTFFQIHIWIISHIDIIEVCPYVCTVQYIKYLLTELYVAAEGCLLLTTVVRTFFIGFICLQYHTTL